MNTAACKFCGQLYTIDIEDPDWADHKGDMVKVATMRCTCEGARDYQKREQQIQIACDNVDMAFYEDYPRIAEMLKSVVPYVADGTIDKLTIARPRMKAAVAKTGKNTIKVTRTDSEVKEYDE